MFEGSQPSGERPARAAVIYYSARGNTHALARAVAEGAVREGAEVRLRHVAEFNQEMVISVKQYWGRHRSEIEHLPDASLEDIEWERASISGFRRNANDRLTPIPGSVRSLDLGGTTPPSFRSSSCCTPTASAQPRTPGPSTSRPRPSVALCWSSTVSRAI